MKMSKMCTVQNSLKADDEDLKTFWCSLFNLDSFPSYENGELQDVTLLFNTALTLFKKLHSKLKETECQSTTLTADLQASKLEVDDLKKELNRLNHSSCQNCLVLEEVVDKYIKKLKDHESRIKSIANILNIHHTQITGPQEQNPTERAYNLVSQMLLGGADIALPAKRRHRQEMTPTKVSSYVKSPKKKKTDSKQNLEEKEFTEVQGTSSSQKDTAGITAHNVVISETLCIIPKDSELPFTDEKVGDAVNNESISVVSLESPDLNSGTVSPVLSNTPKKQSVRFIKNLSITEVHKRPCEKTNTTSGKYDATTVLKNEEVCALDKTKCSLELEAKNIHEKKPDFWNLKPKHTVEYQPSAGSVKQSRRLKQTQLSVGCFSKRTDIGSLEEFNAGIRKTSTQFSNKIDADFEDELLHRAIQESLKYSEESRVCSSEDDDIVLESPNASQSKKILAPQTDNLKRMCDTDITVFVPGNKEKQPGEGILAVQKADGTEGKNRTKKELVNSDIEKGKNTSFDRLPKKKSKSPNYKYRHGTVRKKELRQALEGWDCDVCQKYYESGENGEEEKRHMNHCSRHRNKYPVRAKTPPGFWDPDFPTTQECRNKMLDVTQACKVTKNKGKTSAK